MNSIEDIMGVITTDAVEEYIEDNKQFNKSKLIENFVKKEIQKIEDEKNK